MITERISKYLEIKGITKYKFCKDLGFSNGFLDKPREIATDKYANILDYFPELNPDWLLTGKGEMIKKQNVQSEGENTLEKLLELSGQKAVLDFKYKQLCEEKKEVDKKIIKLSDEMDALKRELEEIKKECEELKNSPNPIADIKHYPEHGEKIKKAAERNPEYIKGGDKP